MLKKPKQWPLYFRAWRKHRHLTQDQVAERMEISQNNLSRIENGVVAYTRETLEGLAFALGVEPADLLRPPESPPDEFSAYVMKLDAKKRAQALRILRAALGEEEVA